MSSSAAEAGRLGGRARALNLSAERRREIAREGWVGRSAKRLHGVSKRECVERIVDRIREYGETDLADFVQWAMGRAWLRTAGFIDLLDDRSFVVVARAVEAVLTELGMEGLANG